MKRVVAAISASMMVFGLASCTPKPVDAHPVAEDFLAALAAGNEEELASLIDVPSIAQPVISDTFDGLQAESLTATLGEVDVRNNIATANYTLNWDLPRERSLTYDTSMTLTKTGGGWTVRWQPTLLHPSLGANQHLELRPIPAGKASVISSDGADILQPGVAFRLLVNTDELEDVRPVAARIAAVVNAAHERDETVTRIDAGMLAEKLDRMEGTYSVMMINSAEGQTIAEELAGVEGVILNEEAAMITVDPGFAPDIMARVSGIVADELEGANGWRVSAVNEYGAALDDVEMHPAQPAPAIRISLDRDIQRAAQDAVNLRPESEAMLVAIRPSTGQVLAVAQTEKADESGDLALSGQYPPGSVFKILTAASGLQHEGLTPESIVACPGTMNIYGREVINYNSFALGNVPLDRAFASSCNTTFAEISTNLEPGQLQDTAKQFGLGLDFDIPGLGTVTGSVPEGEIPLDRTEAGYGQGLNLASPFGLALVSATAAHGSIPTPVLIEGHETTISEDVPELDPEMIGQVQSMMRSVVTSGSARGMAANGEISGKTGEAEINEGSHSWFAGFRDDDIAFATLVVLGGGSETAVSMSDYFFQKIDEFRSVNEVTP